MRKYVQIFGMPRSGTNFLAQFLNQNFEVDIFTNNDSFFKDPINKHLIPTGDFLYYLDQLDNIFIAHIIKHPYRWIISRMEFTNENMNNLDLIKHFCCQWNERNQAWLNMGLKYPDKYQLIKWEDIARYQYEWIEKLGKKFLKIRNQAGTIQIQERVDKFGNIIKGDFINKTDIIINRYKEKLSKDALYTIDKSIGWDLTSELGYSHWESEMTDNIVRIREE